MSAVKKKRIFISFAIEDKSLKEMLRGQARGDSPFEFVDMSVKRAWDNAWKTNCRSRIKGCDGLIGIITRNSPKADGQLWEIKCAREEGIPLLLIRPQSQAPVTLGITNPPRVNIWNWDNITKFINKL